MTRQKRKLFITIILIIAGLIGLVIFIFRPNPLHQTTTIEPDGDRIDDLIEQVENMDEEVQTATNDLSQNLKDAVEQTLTIFTRTDYRITALGDSLTQGVGDESNGNGYIGVLERRLSDHDYRVRFDNFGRRGNRTDQLLTRLDEENSIKRSVERADIVLITIGANDIMRIVRENFLDLNEDAFDLERTSYEERLTDIFEKLNEFNPDAEIFLIGFFNPFEGYFNEVAALEDILISWNQTSEAVAESYLNGHYISIRDLFQLEQINLLADDNFHPNATGYSLMGARVLNEIIPTLEQLSMEQEENVEGNNASLE
ncbi:SGNH/GDSL hydrolase family protein [Amphibacillus marinus]|nr:SGNH/GDSL hydrolase family protein [Amphibacillus marinus]